MDRRSSTGTHFQSELIARVESSHGVRLDGGSTGGIVEAFGTDTNISLTVRAKNTGILTLGNSSNTVSVAGSSATFGTSTSPVSIEGSSIRIGISTTAQVLIQASSVTIGVSTSPVRLLGSSFYFNSTQIRLGSTASSIVIGNSTTFFTAVQRYLVSTTIPVLAASQNTDVTYAVTGLSTGSGIFVNVNRFSAVWSTAYAMVGAHCSTTDELTIRWLNNSASTIGTAGTTMSFVVLEFKY